MSGAEETIRKVLHTAGIEAGGTRAFDIKVINPSFYARVLRDGTLGLGESYMDGWWECEDIPEFIRRLIQSEASKSVRPSPRLLLTFLGAWATGGWKRLGFEVGKRHYDLGNNLYEAMLGASLTYTCGYWKNAQTLDAAQEAKLDLVCRKIGLRPGMKVLDIGCGWGSLLKFAAEKYGVTGVGITVSREQAELAREMCKNLPIEIRLEDYRDTTGVYDRIVSLGMFEHVGYRKYRTYARVVRNLLKPDGLFLLHTIGGNISVRVADPWIHRYIFPNGMLPSIAQIGRAIENLFVMEDWHNFGADYEKTLLIWWQNFEAHWPELREEYDERFHRMWRYYLLACAGAFRARSMNLWQIVLSPEGLPGGYESVR